MTIDELREKMGKAPRTFQVAWAKCGLTNYAKGREVSEEEKEKIFAYYGKPADAKQEARPVVVRANARKPVAKQVRPKQRVSISDFRDAAFNLVCIAIVVGHAGLIWYDCWALWAAPGAIGGAIAFLVVLAALLVATDKTRVRTSEYAMAFVFIIDAAAWFAHYPAFMLTAKVGATTTGVLAALLCGMSFAALYLFRDHKID